MDDYPPRVEKSENIYKLWETGEGDMAELAIGLYDLTAHYKALWDDYAQLEAENEGLKKRIRMLEANTSKSVLRRLDAQGISLDSKKGKASREVIDG